LILKEEFKDIKQMSEIKKLNDEIKKYVKNHPYPTYREMCNKLPDELSMEYNEELHECVKTIYNNLTNKKMCRELGFKIYDILSHEGMVKMFYILRYVCKGCYLHGLDSAWDGIGQWSF
jgi:hypothetical protein